MSSMTDHDDNGHNSGHETLHDLEKGAGVLETSAVAAKPHHHAKVANPAPLGLLAFATSIFLLSLFNVHPRGIQTSNIVISNMMFFGGAAQLLAGIMDFVHCNNFGAVVFSAFATFNLAYTAIFLPGTGILSAYEDSTGALSPEFDQAVAMFCWGWFMISVIFTVASIEQNVVIFLVLFFLDLNLMLQAISFMIGSEKVMTAACVMGFICGAFTYYAGAAGLYAGTTHIRLPVGNLAKED